MGDKFVAERADFFGGLIIKESRHAFGKVTHHAVGHGESGGENHARFVNHIGRQTPAVRQVAARGGGFVIKDERNARVFESEDTRGNRQLEGAVHRADPFGRQTKFFFQIKRAALGRQFNGLHRGGQAFKAVVAVFGFNDELDVFVDLFLLDFGGNGFNHVAAGEDFVQHAFAENFVPAAGAASGDTADDHGFFTAVVRSGARAGRGFGHRGRYGAFGFFHRGGVARYPVYKSGVKGRVVAVHIGTGPIQMDAGRNEVGEQVVKFHDTAFFGVVGSQHFDVFLVGQGVGGQSGKYAFGAAFHEQAHTGIVGGLQLFNPFHGVGNLRDHKVFDFFRVGRIEFRRHVGGNGHGGRVEF